MITLNENYTIGTDSTHGFTLKFEGAPIEKTVNTKKGKEVKLITPTDTWYYPKMSQVLEKFYSLNLSSQNEKELLERIIKIENNINDFSKTFAVKGKIKQL